VVLTTDYRRLTTHPSSTSLDSYDEKLSAADDQKNALESDKVNLREKNWLNARGSRREVRARQQPV